jgi:crotonobetainyl-CoA:carnitine CoA-transferase CaiB-like acyl-CoA transferase
MRLEGPELAAACLVRATRFEQQIEMTEHFATNAARIGNRTALNDLIAQALADEPRALWGTRFDAAGVPVKLRAEGVV